MIPRLALALALAVTAAPARAAESALARLSAVVDAGAARIPDVRILTYLNSGEDARMSVWLSQSGVAANIGRETGTETGDMDLGDSGALRAAGLVVMPREALGYLTGPGFRLVDATAVGDVSGVENAELVVRARKAEVPPEAVTAVVKDAIGRRIAAVQAGIIRGRLKAPAFD